MLFARELICVNQLLQILVSYYTHNTNLFNHFSVTQSSDLKEKPRKPF